MQTLLTTYEQIIASLIDETEACLEGDRIDLSLFILEPGDTSERLLAALVEAADRNVSVAITIDDSYASRFARWWEKTQTLLPRATGHAAEREGLFRVLARKEPNHAKYAAFVRRDERKSCALVMSANLGDRFRMWKDYAVRVVGERHVRGLLRKIAGGPGAHPVLPLPPSETAFVANVPPSQRFEIRSVLRTLFAGNAYDRYRIAMAYVDHAGARYLRAALDRGASVEIVMPRKANVYTHANLRTAARLIALPKPPTVHLHPEMVHAKAIWASGPNVPSIAFLGSANLKRNSLRTLGELNVLTTEASVTDALASDLDALQAESVLLEERPPYDRFWAVLEERFG